MQSSSAWWPERAPGEHAGAVLVIESDESTAALERHALLGAGFAVHSVARPEEASSLLRDCSFSAIVLDYRLPEEDAWALLDAANAKVPRVPLIIVKMSGNETAAADAIQRGAPACIPRAEMFWDVLPGIVERVTRIAVAEERLRHSDALFQLIANNTSDIIVVTDPFGTCKYISPACAPLLGYSPEELIGTSWLDLIHPEDCDRVRACLANIAGCDRDTVICRCLRQDGASVWIESSVNLLRDAVTGMVTEVVAVSRDITGWKRSDDDRLFRVVVEAAPNAMLMMAVDGRIVLVNSETERLFGYARGELLGQSVEFLISPPYRPCYGALRAAFPKTPARQMQAGRDLFGLCKDGSEVPIEIGLNPIHTSNGDFVLACVIDITERMKAERQKTFELQRSLLEKTTLLKEVHHRVKNNLQVICSLLSLQIDYCEEKRLSGPLHDAHHRVLAMSLIHEQLYQSNTLSDLDFGEYVELLAGQLFHAYCVDPARIRLQVNVEPVHLSVDHAIPCGLILNELLANSLKHAFPGDREGVIQIRFCKVNTARAELCVIDNGIGLPPNFRCEYAQSLGLQVVRTLIGQLKATLEVSGNAGTAFRVNWDLGAGGEIGARPRTPVALAATAAYGNSAESENRPQERALTLPQAV